MVNHASLAALSRSSSSSWLASISLYTPFSLSLSLLLFILPISSLCWFSSVVSPFTRSSSCFIISRHRWHRWWLSLFLFVADAERLPDIVGWPRLGSSPPLRRFIEFNDISSGRPQSCSNSLVIFDPFVIIVTSLLDAQQLNPMATLFLRRKRWVLFHLVCFFVCWGFQALFFYR